ncbi:hypothetical protein [Bacillus sp. S/N-304-OC-R1]|nr:hypothetical protein [Bacillus sp. S/N-304-OC-R1]
MTDNFTQDGSLPGRHFSHDGQLHSSYKLTGRHFTDDRQLAQEVA